MSHRCLRRLCQRRVFSLLETVTLVMFSPLQIGTCTKSREQKLDGDSCSLGLTFQESPESFSSSINWPPSRHPTSAPSWQPQRSETRALHNLVESSSGRVVFIKLDTPNQSDINDAVKHVKSTLQGRSMDMLINNAAILPLHARRHPGHGWPR